MVLGDLVIKLNGFALQTMSESGIADQMRLTELILNDVSLAFFFCHVDLVTVCLDNKLLIKFKFGSTLLAINYIYFLSSYFLHAIVLPLIL